MAVVVLRRRPRLPSPPPEPVYINERDRRHAAIRNVPAQPRRQTN